MRGVAPEFLFRLFPISVIIAYREVVLAIHRAVTGDQTVRGWAAGKGLDAHRGGWAMPAQAFGVRQG